jgi:2-oxoisovalerate dehydrogenase E1 component alpha subunit
VRGVKPRELLMYWGGDERGNDFSGPRMTSLVRADRHPMPARGRRRAGVQAARRTARGGGDVGDGGSSKTDFYAAVNSPAPITLPLVRDHQQPVGDLGAAQAQTGAETLAQKGIAGGLDCVQVDGNDLLAVRAAMDLALEARARGHGGSVIER